MPNGSSTVRRRTAIKSGPAFVGAAIRFKAIVTA
jgi:hypothetical protein